MFRRGTSSPGKIHYRINIDKGVCPDPVDIYIDGDTCQYSFNGAYLDIYHKRIEVIRIVGQIVPRDQRYEYDVSLGATEGVSSGTLTYLYDSGTRCDLAYTGLYGDRITSFTPITGIIDPEEIIDFTYTPEFYDRITGKARINWQGDLMTNGYRIVTDACDGCQSVAVGTGVYDKNHRVDIVIVAP